MKLLVISQYFWPETFTINRIVHHLSLQGVDVTILTGKPNYPQGQIYKGYKSKGIHEEKFGKVNVIRLPLRPRKTGLINLALNYLSFAINGIIHTPKLLKNKKYDAIFVYAPSPLTVALPAIWWKKITKQHLVLWVQDLWPESLSATGHVNNKIVLTLTKKMVQWIYSQSNTILGQSHAFVNDLQSHVNKTSVFYYPNSIDEILGKKILTPSINMNFFDSLNTIVFAGNIGSVQSIPTILKAAHLLQQKNIDCKIVFVGAGSLLESSKRTVKTLSLKNVYFIPPLDHSYMPFIYKYAAASLVTLNKNIIFSKTIPAKLQSSMAAAKPIIAAIDGEGAQIIRDSGGGYVSSPEDPYGLFQNIQRFCLNSLQERKKMGLSGHRYFMEHFEVKQKTRDLIKLINKRIQ